MQEYHSQVLAYAKDLEGQIPTQQIASATKKHFKGIMSCDSVAEILHKKNNNYFDKSKIRKSTKKVSLKTRAINMIKSLNADDPKLESLIQELSEPFQVKT